MSIKAKRWIFLIAFLLFILLMFVTGFGIGWSLINGGEIWGWLPFGCAGIGMYLVLAWLRADIEEHLFSNRKEKDK